ncbi:dihydrodipicolinate synthase family protein [Fusobacterium simiae]|uniref:Dihydrodipicolinate synthase family protein n=1 Tax=Fusobacterium simiae TaxID=855 RepID=A0ABT4DIQ2_FUSSI|nr:dihydrodipicolinate synthase family protein [Fusobacterium simiae]MCY7008480.1 dihydrodipicolinate synthase family protein [Fusobacterium simiae]
MNNLKGVFPPVITVFKKDGSIDLQATKKHMDYLINSGVNGLAYFGTTGEFFSLSLKEKKEYVDEILKYNNKRTKILVGVGSTNKDEVMEFIEYLKGKDIAAILLINPYFSIYDETEVEAYYNYVAQNTNLKIIIYNFPQLTGFNFPVSLVEKLVKNNTNIVGIKDTVTDQTHLIDMLNIKELKEDFIVYCAFESQSLGALASGAEGFINATANFIPEVTVGLWKAYKEKNFEQCCMYYRKMCQAMEIYKLSTPLLLACKKAVYENILGYDGYEKLPALPLDNKKIEKLKSILKTLKID